MFPRKIAVLGFCCAALAAAAPSALAQTTVYVPNSLTLQVPVTATVGEVCGFASTGVPGGLVDFGDLNGGAFTQDVPFTLECSVPLRMAIVSDKGGLLLSSGFSAAGYTNLAPYNVTLFIQGTTTSVSDTCSAADLKSSVNPCSFRGTATDSIGLRLNDTSFDVPGSYIRLRNRDYPSAYPGSPVLIASNSNYVDTLTVTLAAAP
jgi:hypothetical protein